MKLIVLVGSTGVGKTDFSIALAQLVGGEVISADASQVYRGLSIGTAKPTWQERQGVVHHLLDVCDPWASFPLPHYLALATQAIASIYKRGRVPILVGGTGLYIQALLSAYQVPAVPPQPHFRLLCERLVQRSGAHHLHHLLHRRDEAAADRIHPNNVQRVIRALEIARYGQGHTAPAAPRYQVLGYQLVAATDLRTRLRERFQIMLAKGWLAEVRWLRACGAHAKWQSMQAIGYCDWLAYLAGEQDWQKTCRDIERATWKLVKRQRTWWRRWSSWPTLAPSAPHACDTVATAWDQH